MSKFGCPSRQQVTNMSWIIRILRSKYAFCLRLKHANVFKRSLATSTSKQVATANAILTRSSYSVQTRITRHGRGNESMFFLRRGFCHTPITSFSLWCFVCISWTQFSTLITQLGPLFSWASDHIKWWTMNLGLSFIFICVRLPLLQKRYTSS